jgi:predicted transcriptional regulator
LAEWSGKESASLNRRVLEVITESPGLSKSRVEAEVGGNHSRCRAAIEDLVHTEAIEARKEGNATRLYPKALSARDAGEKK